jgi:hypothetical protein
LHERSFLIYYFYDSQKDSFCFHVAIARLYQQLKVESRAEEKIIHRGKIQMTECMAQKKAGANTGLTFQSLLILFDHQPE